MIMKIVTMQFDEKLAYILEPAEDVERINRARAVVQADVTFLPLVKMGVTAGGIKGIPEGVPETYKADTDLPMGIAGTTLRQEFRRVKNFLPGGSVENLLPFKREQLWIQILEGIHHKEAEILTMIKDKTLLKNFPSLAPVCEALGLEIIVPKTPGKRNRKKD
jgi:hypothetical protein